MLRRIAEARKGREVTAGVESGNEAIHQPMLEGVMRQLGIILKLHLFKDARPVGIDGADPDAEVVCNLFKALADRNQTHDLIFAVRQQFMLRLLRMIVKIRDE